MSKNKFGIKLVGTLLVIVVIFTLGGCGHNQKLREESEARVEQLLEESAEKVLKEKATPTPLPTATPTSEPTPSAEDYIKMAKIRKTIAKWFDDAVADFYDESMLDNKAIKEIEGLKESQVNYVILMAGYAGDGTLTEEECTQAVNEAIENYVIYVKGFFE